MQTPITPSQIIQLAETAKDASLNNLVAVMAILCIILVIGIVVVIFKFAPIVLKQIQQLIDNNTQLTKIAEQNSNQVTLTEQAIQKNTSEMAKQTSAIEAQTTEIKTQSLDFRSYQILVSDGLANHSSQVESNTARVDANTAMLERFEKTLNELPEQLRVLIDDKLKCSGIETSIQALRDEVVQLVAQQTKRATNTNAAVSNETPPKASPE